MQLCYSFTTSQSLAEFVVLCTLHPKGHLLNLWRMYRRMDLTLWTVLCSSKQVHDGLVPLY